jgi:hypothetical protein
MKLVNKTNLDTKQLKAFIRRVAKAEFFAPADIKKLQVRAIHRRRSSCWADDQVSGYAYYGVPKMILKFVKDVMPDKVQMAKTTAHELAHTQNVKHGSAMRNNRYGWKPGWREIWAWAAELPLTLKTPVEKPSRDRKVLEKLTHSLKMAVVWGRKVHLAKTKQKKWEKKARYYEKQIVKAAAPPETKPQEPAHET